MEHSALRVVYHHIKYVKGNAREAWSAKTESHNPVPALQLIYPFIYLFMYSFNKPVLSSYYIHLVELTF